MIIQQINNPVNSGVRRACILTGVVISLYQKSSASILNQTAGGHRELSPPNFRYGSPPAFLKFGVEK